jgi:hypothetical protein
MVMKIYVSRDGGKPIEEIAITEQGHQCDVNLRGYRVPVTIYPGHHRRKKDAYAILSYRDQNKSERAEANSDGKVFIDIYETNS